MIKSMTAFASVDQAGEHLSATVEIRTYNSRYLDVFLRVAPGYAALEEKIKASIGAKLARGRVEVKIQIKDSGGDESSAFEVDADKVRSYYNALREMGSLLGIQEEIPLSLLAGRGELIKPKEKDSDTDATWVFLEGCLNEALDSLESMRRREGAFIAGDFLERLNFIKESIDEIEKQSADIPAIYQARLMERIARIIGDAVALDAGRLEQEAAILADRSDISEEITRVKSHLVQFKLIMDDEEPAGQKLNFLLQEINREFNTIGSKAGKSDISHLVVNVKSELEKIREQVQNVE